MLNYHSDQAEGLRRIMASTNPRVVSVLSATGGSDSSHLLTNVASSLSVNGANVVLVHPSNITAETRYTVDEMPDLLSVANYQTPLLKALQQAPEGFAVAKLTHQNNRTINVNNYQHEQLETVFDELSKLYDMVLVDATLNQAHALPLNSLHEQDILIELSHGSDSIMQAYSLMKRICSQFGKRSFSIVVSEATESEGTAIFNRIAEVAMHYLNISLSFFGAIPTDEYLKHASSIGRSVIDVFPTTMAASAFQSIAQRLDNGFRLQWQTSALPQASMI